MCSEIIFIKRMIHIHWEGELMEMEIIMLSVISLMVKNRWNGTKVTRDWEGYRELEMRHNQNPERG